MQVRILLVAFSIPFLFACQPSEVADKPAAEVSPAGNVQAGAHDGNVVSANVIREKSSISFVGARVTRDHQGQFPDFNGTIDYANAKPVGVSFEIDLRTVETDTDRLTEHLKTPDFFDVARYPTATFTSTSLTELPRGPAGATHELRGTLDLHGVKKDVAFPVTAQVNSDGVRTTSEFTINRQEWGVSYRGAADDLVRDEVLIRLDLSFPPPPEQV